MRTTNKITILLVDNNPLSMDLWTYFLNSEPLLNVIAHAKNGAEAIEIAKRLKPLIVLIDINMLSGDGPQAIREIGKLNPVTLVIAIGFHNNISYANRMLRLGARGYISRKSIKEDILVAVLTVSKGDQYISPETRNCITQIKHHTENTELKITSLTRREFSIIDLVRKGLPSKIIASQLGISVKTVEVHRYHILKKLKVKNTATLVNFLNINGM